MMEEKANGEQGPEQDKALEDVERGFRQWREGHKTGTRIPPQLWAAAAELAREHGVSRIAKKLGLDFGSLKMRMEGVAGAAGATAEPRFVEVFAAPAASAEVMRECVIELENEHGAKMRVELNGPGLAGLAHLCSSFWGAA
jgi:hypothetical protein